ncbi:hypothetical protein [Spirochaeta cellobiosiphila]|uniref:hypothetical protein n=1 Tax=Spirochaeta cellobiosiphila TaxID=504483 RepID=UPI0003FF6961|nr:hypothetical protein [Spirochaeta cellobiosiphila]
MDQNKKELDMDNFDRIQSHISDQIIGLINGKFQEIGYNELDLRKNNLLTSIRELENLVRGYL